MDSHAMKMISESHNLTLNWIQSGVLKRRYILLSGEDPVASLHWVRGTLPHAIGQTADGKWTFHSSRLLYPRVTIQSLDNDRLEAIFEISLKGRSRLSYTDGRNFYWDSTNFWNNEWEFATVEGERLVKFVPEQGLFKIGARIVLEEDALEYQELPLLIVTGWYLLVSMSQENSDLSSLTQAIRAK
jgi:hypothetical protein